MNSEGSSGFSTTSHDALHTAVVRSLNLPEAIRSWPLFLVGLIEMMVPVFSRMFQIFYEGMGLSCISVLQPVFPAVPSFIISGRTGIRGFSKGDLFIACCHTLNRGIPMPKVLILTGDAVETHELYYPFWRLKEAGIEVTVAAPSRKEALFTVVHDFEPGWDTVSEKPGYRFLQVDAAFKDVKPDEYDGVILPGGRAPEYMRMHAELEPIIRHFFDAEKPVAAMCHGVLLIAKYGLAKGRRMTTFSIVTPDLVQAGAECTDQEVVVDGNLVTSRTYFDLPAFMREFLKLLRVQGSGSARDHTNT